MKWFLKVLHVLSAFGLLFHFSIASAKIRALLSMVFPIQLSYRSVSGVPWASANVVHFAENICDWFIVDVLVLE